MAGLYFEEFIVGQAFEHAPKSERGGIVGARERTAVMRKNPKA